MLFNDGRNVNISFSDNGKQTKVTETFKAESTHPLEVQQGGWQAILNSFKKLIRENNIL